MTASPRFSLVVPTRNRARTLAYHLRTCLAQQFDDFEVVVSDNFSPPETREVALSFGDPRIKYVRTPADLSMTDSLEFALEHATGEYVSVLGDDDGYLLHALKELDKLLTMTKAPALRWDAASYNWPDIPAQGYAEPNTLLLPLRQGRDGHVLQRHESPLMIQAAADGAISYADLPMIYCAVVRRDVFEQLRRRTGRVFKSRTADVYAGFAVACVARFFYSLDAPMTLAGASGSSTGIARHFQRPGSAIDEQFRRSSDAAGHAWHATVPDLPPIAASVADAVLYLKEALESDAAVAVDRRRLIGAVLAELVVDGEASWRHALAACRRALEDDAALLAWFDAAHAARPAPDDQASPRKQAQRRYGATFLALDASEHGVADTYGAAQLCERLLGYRRDGIDVALRERPAAVTEDLTELQAKERQIQTMHKAILEQQQVIDRQRRTIGELEAPWRPGRWLRGLVPSPVRRLFGRPVP